MRQNLAPKMTDADQSPLLFEDRHRCFTVIAGGETFGLPITAIQTIFRIEDITPVPLCPYEIIGLTNLRGQIVTALSLRRRLRMKDDPNPNDLLAIAIEHRNESFALVIDEVGDVITLDPQSRIVVPPHLNPISAALTEAVFRLENGILPILDIANLFDLGPTGTDRSILR